MLLYGHHDSGHAYKVRLFLLLTQTPHAYRWVDIWGPSENRPSDFRAASAYGEVPVLVDEGRNWCQSNAILIHLAQKTQRLTGTPAEWPRVVEWLFWEPNRINYSVPQLRYSAKFEALPEGLLAFLRARAATDLQRLNTVLAEHPFLLPSGPTIADLSCASYLFWADQAQLDLSTYPHVQRWLSDIARLPHWQTAEKALSPEK
jgi:glutathione S-transferase